MAPATPPRLLIPYRLQEREYYCAWINGTFDFQLQPLPAILSAVADWYGIEIFYDEKRAAAFNCITLEADRREDYRSVLNILQKATGFEYTITGNKVYITF